MIIDESKTRRETARQRLSRLNVSEIIVYYVRVIVYYKSVL